jgi:hypothetical protein
MPRGLKVSRPLIITMILFVSVSIFFEFKDYLRW